MSEPFDPYYKWLAIRPKDQPPNHYRLLGIELFEDDADVIGNSADQRMAHVKSYQSSEHVAFSQQLLNEIATAQACLLNGDQKQRYDATLGRGAVDDVGSAGVEGAAEEVAEAAPLIMTSDKATGDSSTPPRSSSRASSAEIKKRAFKINLIGHILAPVIGLAIGAAILSFVLGGGDEGTIVDAPTEEVVKKPSTPRHKKPGRDSGRRKPRQDHPRVPHEQPSQKPADPGTDVVDPPGELATPSPIEPDVKKPAEPKPPPKPPTPPPKPPAPTPEEQLAKLEAEHGQAVGKGDADRAMALASQIAELKGEDTLTVQVATITAIRDRAVSAQDYQRLAKAAIIVAQRAIDANRKEEAVAVAKIGLLASRQSGDADLTRQATLVWIKATALK